LVVWRDSPPNFALASAYSVLLVVLTSIGIFLYARVLRRNGQYATITKRKRPQHDSTSGSGAGQ
jgi:ABC-type Fe3+ transport system permease subunit